MDKAVKTIKDNINRLLELRNIPSRRKLAELAGINPKSVNNILTDTPSPSANPTVINLRKIAKALGVETWMLLIDDFPFEAIKGKRISKISPDGYALLKAFDSSKNEMLRYTILEFASYTLEKESENNEQINELKKKYIKKDELL